MGSILSASYDPSCTPRSRALPPQSSQRSISARGAQRRSRSLQATEPYFDLNTSDHFKASVARTGYESPMSATRSCGASPASSSRSWAPPRLLGRPAATAAQMGYPSQGRFLNGTAKPFEVGNCTFASRTPAWGAQAFPWEGGGAARPGSSSSRPPFQAEPRSVILGGSEPRRAASHPAQASRPPRSALPAESEDPHDPYIWLPASAQWVQGDAPSSHPQRPWLLQEVPPHLAPYTAIRASMVPPLSPFAGNHGSIVLQSLPTADGQAALDAYSGSSFRRGSAPEDSRS